jgi:UPF0755 protein
LDEKNRQNKPTGNAAEPTSEPQPGAKVPASPEPDETAELPVAFWQDEDPNIVPPVAMEQNRDRAFGHEPEPNQREASSPPITSVAAENASAAQLGDNKNGANGPASFQPSEVSFGAVAPPVQETSPPPTAQEEAVASGGTSPTFPSVAHRILPPCEETQEVPASKQRRKRSFFGQLVNLFWWLIVASVFALIIFTALYYRYASDRLYNIQFDTNQTVVLTVAPGERLSHIIEKLRAEGLLGSYLGVDDGILLKYLAWLNNNSNKIKSGVYRLNSSMSLSQIYDKLIEGSQDFKVTIPEGKTAKETAVIISRKLDSFSQEKFLALVHDPDFIAKLGLSVPSLEGYLYPDTYFFAPGMKEEDIIRMMVENFIKRAEASLANIERTETSDTLSFHEHVIMASLIEREARLDTERPLIASVIFNRLKKGMKLEIDAAVNYALGDWGKRLTYADLQTSSAYNTYLHKGLPPGPICNPHISSLIATFQPARTNYLYYVYKGDGSHAFAETYEEHLANIRLYRRSSSNARYAGDAKPPETTLTPTMTEVSASVAGHDQPEPSQSDSNELDLEATATQPGRGQASRESKDNGATKHTRKKQGKR